MAIVADSPLPTAQKTLRLEPGDHLTRTEFERRYQAMLSTAKAELIEGIVTMPSPVRLTQHGKPHGWLMGWLIQYEAVTPGTESADNSTIRLDLENEPQPDGLLRIFEKFGGQSRIDDEGYVAGSPELIVEVAASSAACDLHEKKRAYRRNGVREYLVWLVEENRVEWWELVDDDYVPLPAFYEGSIESRVFPGLRLDVSALLAGDLARVLETVRKSATSPEHDEFVKRLR